MYPAESGMAHPQQQQPQQGAPKPYPYTMQTPYSSMSAQHFMTDPQSTGQPTQQQQQQDVYQQQQQQQPQQPQPQPVPNQMHNTSHYR